MDRNRAINPATNDHRMLGVWKVWTFNLIFFGNYLASANYQRQTALGVLLSCTPWSPHEWRSPRDALVCVAPVIIVQRAHVRRLLAIKSFASSDFRKSPSVCFVPRTRACIAPFPLCLLSVARARAIRGSCFGGRVLWCSGALARTLAFARDRPFTFL